MKNSILTVLATIILGFSSLCFFVGMTQEKKIVEPTRYCGGSSFEEKYENLSFARKETTSKYTMKGDVPNYNGHVDAPNCANVAGAELIGYYDRFYEDLVPNCKTYIQMGNSVIYRAANAAIVEVMTSLRDYMGTDNGTTFNGFHRGMRTYVEKHNLSYSTEDLGHLNFDEYKTAVESNKPVALFLSDYSFYLGAVSNASGEMIKTEHSNVAHVVVGCGYQVDTYYDSLGNVIFTRSYLKIASGFATRGLTYLCLDGQSTIDRATAVIIS